jgi:hypothetical protein
MPLKDYGLSPLALIPKFLPASGTTDVVSGPQLRNSSMVINRQAGEPGDLLASQVNVFPVPEGPDRRIASPWPVNNRVRLQVHEGRV